MPRRVARAAGVVDRRTPAEVAAADEFAEQVAEVEAWDAARLAAIRAEVARDDLTPADEDALIERYRALRESRRHAAEVAAETDRRVAKWIMRHGEPRTAAARAELGAYIAKPVVKQQRHDIEASLANARREQHERAEAAAEAVREQQAARRAPSTPGRRPTAAVAASAGEPEPPPRRRRRNRGIVAATLSMFPTPYDEDDD